MSAIDQPALDPDGSLPNSHRIHSPSALGGDFKRFWALTFTLARTEFKLRFYGSILGYIWTLVRPFLLFGVLWVVFTQIAEVNRSGGAASEDFSGTQLLGSLILFTFFMEATSGAVRSVVDRESLVRKIRFPRLAIPLSIVMLACFNLALNLIVVFLFALAEGVQPAWSWLELPVLIVALVLLCAGVAMLLSALFVHFRDIQPIWEVATQVLLYASPIIISVPTILADFHKLKAPPGSLSSFLHHHQFLLNLYMLNPLATIFQQFRHAVIAPGTPNAVAVTGNWATTAGSIALILGVLALGFLVFSRAAERIAENL